MKIIPKTIERQKGKDLHAAIKTLRKNMNADGKYFYTTGKNNKEIFFHFAEDQAQWETGVVRIQLGKEEAEIAIDPLMSVIYTAYDPPIRDKAIGFWEAMKFKMRSFLVKRKNAEEKK